MRERKERKKEQRRKEKNRYYSSMLEDKEKIQEDEGKEIKVTIEHSENRYYRLVLFVK